MRLSGELLHLISHHSKFHIVKIFKSLLNALIVLFIVLITSIILTGGFEINIAGKEISCNGLINPILALTIFLLFRFYLAIGFKNSLVFISALFFSVILAEVVLKVLNPSMALPALKNITQPSDVLSYRLVPLLKDRSIQTNSHGLRDRERSWIKPMGIKRLLGIGDSFTFGYQVDLKDSYLKQLESRLNGSKKQWDVINAGVSGYNMWQYLAYFENFGYRYDPDLVTIGLFFDDFYGDPSFEEEKTDTQRFRSLSDISLVNFIRNSTELLQNRYRYLLGASWLKSIGDRRNHILNSKNHLLLSGKADPELYQKFESRLKKFVNIAKKHGVPVLVLLIPDAVQLHHPELKIVNSMIKNVCLKHEAEYLDMTPYFEKINDPETLYLLPHDAHTSPFGHRIIAREIEKKIKRMPEL